MFRSCLHNPRDPEGGLIQKQCTFSNEFRSEVFRRDIRRIKILWVITLWIELSLLK